MDDKDVGWLVLIGAMLASTAARKQALAGFTRQDVPNALQPLWEALASNDGNKVWAAIGCIKLKPAASGKVLDALIAQLQDTALRLFIEKQVGQAQFAHKAGLGADAVADTFEGVAAAIRQRQAQIAKPQGSTGGKDSSDTA